MSSEQDKDLVAKKKSMLHAELSGEHSDHISFRERLSEDPAPLTQYATLSSARSAQNAPLVIC